MIIKMTMQASSLLRSARRPEANLGEEFAPWNS